jgi:hypothetical protein
MLEFANHVLSSAAVALLLWRLRSRVSTCVLNICSLALFIRLRGNLDRLD